MDNNLHFNEKGVMADVAASPNDPIFINHHTMIDCIMEEWLKSSMSDKIYPTSSSIHEGHRKNDYIVPFIPLYRHSDIFNTSETFGYKCDLSSSDVPNKKNNSEDGPEYGYIAIAIVVPPVAIILGISGGIGFRKYRARKK